MPVFSIVIATHGRPQLLERALKSLRANRFNSYEIIVVSDESNADSFKVAATYLGQNDSFIKRSGKPGPALSRNAGMDVARGEALLFLDDDDIFEPDYLEHAHRAFRAHPEWVTYTNYSVIEENRTDGSIGQRHEINLKGSDPDQILIRNFIPNHCVIYPRHVVGAHRQDPALRSMEDWDFLLAIHSDARFVHADISGPVVFKDYVNQGTRRGTSADATGTQVIPDFLYIYRKWPAPTPELRAARKALFASVGIDFDEQWF
jgi:glycosyltransferase involved in cell wall biosynthesis